MLIYLALLLAFLPGAWFYSTHDSEAAPVVHPIAQGHRLTVLTLNLAKETKIEEIVRELRPADVYLFQEVVRKDAETPSVAEDVAQRMGLQVHVASADKGATGSGIAILSKYPLTNPKAYNLKPIDLVFRSRKRVLLAVTAETPGGPVRIVNAHLDTRINPGDRLRELEPAIADAKDFVGPVLIGGDLNTNDMQWVSHVVPVPWPGWQAARVRDLMSQHGFHTPFTNRRSTSDFLGMQLDWIYLRNLSAERADVIPIGFSDHHALVTVVGPSGP